jgi:integrative and conjugative element protein (TIGR02256 family)
MRRLWRAFKRRQRARTRVIPGLIVGGEARAVIEREAGCFPEAETGGILMGYIDPPATVHITHASGPGPSARRTPTAFLRDTPFCARVLREHYARFGVDYVGEWHSHVLPVREPTVGDIQTLMGIMHDPDYDFSAFAMVLAVVGTEQPSQLELLGFVVTVNGISEAPIEDEPTLS